MRVSKDQLQRLIVENIIASEGLRYHLKNSLPLCENIYRPGSERFFSLICEARKLYVGGNLTLLEEDLEIINTDMGTWGDYMGREVALDFPISQEADALIQTSDLGYHKSNKLLSKVFNNELGNQIEVEVRDVRPEDFFRR